MIWIFQIWFVINIYARPRLKMEVKVRFCKDTVSKLRVRPMCVWLKGSFLAGDSTRRPAALVAAQMYEWSGCRLVAFHPKVKPHAVFFNATHGHHTFAHALGFDVQFQSVAVFSMRELSAFWLWGRREETDTNGEQRTHIDGDCVWVWVS